MDQAQAILGAINGVTKKWARQRKREERRQAAMARRYDALVSSDRVTIKEAAWSVMEEAYMHASNNNTLPAQARQIMYAARGPIQDETGKQLDDQYFCQTLLPDYLKEHPEETANWDVVFDARGHFTEPHTKVVVPLGTLDVRSYLGKVQRHSVPEVELAIAGGGGFPTCGPAHRFQAILFIEKEGFMPLFKAVNLAERYDLAIMSTKGLSVTASRVLVDRLCGEYRIPLLVLHDFDKAGFSIVGTLRRSTRRYEFELDVEVIDLGLRLPNVQKCGLTSESVFYGKSSPDWNLRTNGATEAEIRFLHGGGGSGRRVELNAFTSADLVSWIEIKLKKHGIKKMVPDGQTLAAAYRRAFKVHRLERRMARIARKIQREAQEVKIPDGLEGKVRRALKKHPTDSWDRVISALAASRKREKDEGADTK
jgi:hypothetical protein